jgi:hypothetical protein
MIQRLFIRFTLPVVALAAMVLPAHATVVDYSTTGAFTCVGCTGSGTGTITFGTLTLTYDPIGAGVVNASPSTNASAGAIVITDTSTNNTPINGTFALTIHQAVPSLGNGFLTGALSGSLSTNGSSSLLAFNGSTSLNLGGIEYNLTPTFGSDYALVPPSSGGTTTLEMTVTSTLPEPTFMALTALGFAGMGLVAFRRRRRV